MSWFDAIPKVELHVHLEGAIPHEALYTLIQKYGGDPTVPNIQALNERFAYNDFPQFIVAWSWKNRFLREYEDFEFIAERTARDLASQNIRYAEMFFSPSLFTGKGLRVQELTRAVRSGLSKVPGIEIALIADLVRDYDPNSELACLHQLNEVKSEGVTGIGLGGSEHEFPPAPFKKLFDTARAMGFHTNVHAGEAAGPESVWEAIHELKPERIGHATSAIRDPDLVEYILKNQIILEMCPISNLRTGAARSLKDHPINPFFKSGMMVTINTDDPRMFQTCLADEYRLLVETCGWTKAEICQVILNGIKFSWASEAKKLALIQEFTQDSGWCN